MLEYQLCMDNVQQTQAGQYTISTDTETLL